MSLKGSVESNVLRGRISDPDVIHGMSAYELDVMYNGYDKSLDEWLKEVRGDFDERVEEAKAEFDSEVDNVIVPEAKAELENAKENAIAEVADAETNSLQVLGRVTLESQEAIAEAVAALDEKEVLLWENEDTSQAFTAQTVSIADKVSAGDYDHLRIVFLSETTMTADGATGWVLPSFEMECGQSGIAVDTVKDKTRMFNVYENGNIAFYGDSSTSNVFCIPYKIYGVKNDEVYLPEKGDSVFIRYSANAYGTDFTEEWSEGQNYIGIATGQTAPIEKGGYVWAAFNKGEKGDKGDQGIQGDKGEKGDKGDKGETNISYCANALKRTVKDDEFWQYDVAPIDHEVKVKVEPRNILHKMLPNLSATKNGVTYYVDADGMVHLSGTDDGTGSNIGYNLESQYVSYNPIPIGAGTYTLGMVYDANNGKTAKVQVTMYFDKTMDIYDHVDKTTVRRNFMYSYNHIRNPQTFTIPEDTKITGFYVAVTSSANVDGITATPILRKGESLDIDLTQIEIAHQYFKDGQMEYTTYPVSADGTVSGVRSYGSSELMLSPTPWDTFGGAVTIEAEYNRDINKAFEEIKQAIISLGGNV